MIGGEFAPHLSARRDVEPSLFRAFMISLTVHAVLIGTDNNVERLP